MDKAVVNIAEFGNTSSASLPMTLDQANRAGDLDAGDLDPDDGHRRRAGLGERPRALVTPPDGYVRVRRPRGAGAPRGLGSWAESRSSFPVRDSRRWAWGRPCTRPLRGPRRDRRRRRRPRFGGRFQGPPLRGARRRPPAHRQHPAGDPHGERRRPRGLPGGATGPDARLRRRALPGGVVGPGGRRVPLAHRRRARRAPARGPDAGGGPRGPGCHGRGHRPAPGRGGRALPRGRRGGRRGLPGELQQPRADRDCR